MSSSTEHAARVTHRLLKLCRIRALLAGDDGRCRSRKRGAQTGEIHAGKRMERRALEKRRGLVEIVVSGARRLVPVADVPDRGRQERDLVRQRVVALIRRRPYGEPPSSVCVCNSTGVCVEGGVSGAFDVPNLSTGVTPA